ncbi:MAG: hypothetical protein WBA93_08475 [Microcoleaceae cyanobacterium]
MPNTNAPPILGIDPTQEESEKPKAHTYICVGLSGSATQPTEICLPHLKERSLIHLSKLSIPQTTNQIFHFFHFLKLWKIFPRFIELH